MSSITYEHVWKRFGDVVAVQDLDIFIEDKEFLVFVGPSGCGKTTSLRLLAGLEELSEGNIYIGDNLVNDVAPKDRDIAMVFQSYALYPHMSVYDNMAFGLKLRKTPKKEIERRVHEAAKMLHIEELLDRKPKQLSGGQRQRVAVGRAIVRNPKVFLFDEPLSNLDAELRVEMRVEIARLHREVVGAMERAMGETERRRARQVAYNEEHGITPQTIRKAVADTDDIQPRRHRLALASGLFGLLTLTSAGFYAAWH